MSLPLPPDADLHAELTELAARGRRAKKALKTAMGQVRLATQLLAAYDDDIHDALTRLETRAQEAQHADEENHAAV
jgi:hypothetical protein